MAASPVQVARGALEASCGRYAVGKGCCVPLLRNKACAGGGAALE